MITLTRNEEIALFQVALTLKVKTKQNPFIAVLILAHEQEEISAYTLQKNLLSSLPLRACDNLLSRLEQQGYLQIQDNEFGYSLSDEEYPATYILTGLGEQSAVDKTYWIGEKGLYNVFVSKCNSDEQSIIKIEKIERSEDDRNADQMRTPTEIRSCQNQLVIIGNSECLIDSIEENCFRLKPVNGILEIEANGKETKVKILKEKQVLYQRKMDVEEDEILQELLMTCDDIQYDYKRKAILVSFTKDNLSFNRSITLTNPIFDNTHFDHVELKNVLHIPKDKPTALRWYLELLYKNLDNYFIDDKSFDEYAKEAASPIMSHYQIKVPKRQELIEIFSERKDAFYHSAKLETIDYLNY